MSAARGHFKLTTTSPQLLQQQPRHYYSQWHSPIPYLFGGLAAMLGLMVFALLLLACTSWRLSRQHFDDRGSDIEAGEGRKSVVEEMRVVVIMAGEEKPSFLAKATPMWSGRSSYIGERSGVSVCMDEGSEKRGEEDETGEMP